MDELRVGSRTEVVEVPYVGGEVSMVLILPDAGEFEAFEESLDVATLFGIFEELGHARGELAMPRFESETDLELREVLSDLGMPVAFSGAADFGGMVEGDGGGLSIDAVYHEASVSVDEEGTGAAAATAVARGSPLPRSRSTSPSTGRSCSASATGRPTPFSSSVA